MLPKSSIASNLLHSSRQTVPHGRSCDSKTSVACHQAEQSFGIGQSAIRTYTSGKVTVGNGYGVTRAIASQAEVVHPHTSSCLTELRLTYSAYIFFTTRCYASAVLAMALCLSVRLSVRLSVTSRCSTKTAKRRITQRTPHDSPGTLVF